MSYVAADPPHARAHVARLHPELSNEVIDPLGEIWDEVVHRIVGMMTEMEPDDGSLHINIREEMILELAKLQLYIGEAVVSRRIGDRDPMTIDPAVERAECFDAAGERMIEGTARIFHDRVWSRLLNERWRPPARRDGAAGPEDAGADDDPDRDGENVAAGQVRARSAKARCARGHRSRIYRRLSHIRTARSIVEGRTAFSDGGGVHQVRHTVFREALLDPSIPPPGFRGRGTTRRVVEGRPSRSCPSTAARSPSPRKLGEDEMIRDRLQEGRALAS